MNLAKRKVEIRGRLVELNSALGGRQTLLKELRALNLLVDERDSLRMELQAIEEGRTA